VHRHFGGEKQFRNAVQTSDTSLFHAEASADACLQLPGDAVYIPAGWGAHAAPFGYVAAYSAP